MCFMRRWLIHRGYFQKVVNRTVQKPMFAAVFCLLLAGQASATDSTPHYKTVRLFRSIAQNWHPTQECACRENQAIVVSFTLDKKGKLLTCKIVKSSGIKACDREALTAIQKTKYESLPDWYLAKQLEYQINIQVVARYSDQRLKDPGLK
jgi:TonB family protein